MLSYIGIYLNDTLKNLFDIALAIVLNNIININVDKEFSA